MRGGQRAGAGRKPKTDEEKRARQSFRATPEEWERLKTNAQKHNMNASEFIRHRCCKKERQD